ncbi:MAG: serine--tRNA ligase, partial [Chloroflexi bacterium]|nr:serine--tRNA ligase [Chloroflexota bacterium]
MLDMDFIVQNPNEVKAAIVAKGVDLDLDAVLTMHLEVKGLLTKAEELRQQRNALSKQTKSATKDERQALIERSREVGGALKELEPGLREKQEALHELLLLVPN